MRAYSKRFTRSDAEKVKNFVKKNSWYRQAANAKILFISTACFGVMDEMHYPIIYCNSREHENYISADETKREARAIFNKSKKETKYIDSYYSIFLDCAKKLDLILSDLEATDFSKIDLNHLTKMMQEMDYWNYQMWLNGFLVDKFDPEGEDMLQEEIAKQGLKLTHDELFFLTRPRKLNFLESFRLELCKIAVKRLVDSDNSLSGLKKKFYFIQNSWGNVVYLQKDFYNKELLSVSNLHEDLILEEINKYSEFADFIENRCKNLKPRFKIEKELENIFHLFRILAELRDLRKEMVLRCNHFYDMFARKISKEYEIDLNLLYYALPQEIFNEDIKEKKEVLKERKNGVCFGRINNTPKKGDFILSGKEAKHLIDCFHKKITEKEPDMKGIVACISDKPISGKVCVVLSESHFTKFEKNDILVASMTRPEYIPLMRKASAIITDEGGLTCHAAIVSRELKVPCITGVKVATKILQDGDKVEIDTIKGIIKRVII